MDALLQTLIAFGLILLLARLKVPLFLAVLVGAVWEAVSSGAGPGEMLTMAVGGLTAPKTIGLVGITALLVWLSEAMRAGGRLERIVTLTKALVRRPSLAMVSMPALVGLLPMPGGALFSAPMVASAAESDDHGGGRLSAINYWFRHIWEGWWPMYPGVITALTLTGLPWIRLAPFQFPWGMAMAGAGVLMFRRIGSGAHAQGPPAGRGTRRALLRAVAPIGIILAVWATAFLILRGAVWWLSDPTAAGGAEGQSSGLRRAVMQFLPLGAGLLVSLAYTARSAGMNRRDCFRILASKRLWTLCALVAAVMLFEHVLTSVRGPERIGEALDGAGVPPVLVVALLPWIAGFVTGLAIGFVGPSFPIVLGLVATAYPGQSVLPFVVLAYSFGHLGQMLSPIHLCQVVSNEYFQTPYGPVYRYLLPSAAVLAVFDIGYFLLLRALMG